MSSQGASIALVSLGCSKNLVDAENMLGLLAAEGYEIVEEPEQADVIIVNTCAFIQPAEEEAIEALLDMSDLKKGKRSRVLICTGCLPSRRGGKLAELLPEVDAFVGVGSVSRLPEVVRRTLAGEKVLIGEDFTYSPTAQTPRWRSAPQWTTYLRIADGCSNFCSFCAIPDIRGPYRSRPVDDVVAEFQKMVSEDVREVCLIAQ
ncbi:MAG: 30S ribosomal protein S12 methylthiotransferase RimO, partial [Armatimonadia bacterium]